MAEIRCPMCSKLNPADKDVCQYCQARLKPLIAPQEPSSSPYPFGREDDLPDWLKSLTPEQGQEPESTPQPEEAAPDWLRRIREKSQKESKQEEDSPGWLRQIRGGEDAHPAGPVTGPLPGTPGVTGSLGGDLDWIDRLKTGHLNLPPDLAEQTYPREVQPPAPESSPQHEPPEAKKPPLETPEPGMLPDSVGGSDWIDRLKTGHLNMPAEMLDQTPVDPMASGKPGHEKDGPSLETPGLTGSLGGSLDWIDRLKTGHLNLPSSTVEPPFIPSGMQVDEQPEAQPLEPDPFLPDIRLPEPGSSVEIPPVETVSGPPFLEPSAAGVSDDTPDWLRDFAVLASGETKPAPEADQGSNREAPVEMASPLPAVPAFDHLPDWLKKIEPEGSSAEGIPWSTLEEDQAAASSELPDWLSNLTADRPEGGEPTSKESTTGLPAGIASGGVSAPGEIPSWSDIASSFTDAEASSKSASGLQQGAAQAPSEPSPFAHFLAEQAQPQSPLEKPSLPHPAESAPLSIKDDTPDWLAALESHSTFHPVDSSVPPLSFDEPVPSQEESTIEPFVLADLPDWLAGLGPVRAGIEPSVEFGEEPADLKAGPDSRLEARGEIEEREVEELAPAELPSWVQALRPIESVAPKALESEVDQRVEKSGPLAGLRGALQAESMAGSVVKPPSFAVKLDATDTQKHYARIFDELIATETDPQPAQVEHLISSHRILRLVLAILLLVVVGYPTLTHTKLLPIPRLYSQEIVLLRQAVDALPENAPVLLAVDYELPLAGEMEITASAVVDHLMSKGVRLVTISTTPTGPVMAASLIERITAQPAVHHSVYQDGTRWISLGYLAGGPAGLLNFAQTPKLAAPAFQVDGERAWAKPQLQGVNGLNDFAMVVVLTDSFDTGRIWLEQIQPQMDSPIPFLLVASAQAAPLLRPYLDGGQADGMVSGLAGAASYEQLRQQPGSGTAIWDAFQAGMIGSIAFILIGGIAYLILGLVKPPKTNQETAVSEGVERHGTG